MNTDHSPQVQEVENSKPDIGGRCAINKPTQCVLVPSQSDANIMNGAETHTGWWCFIPGFYSLYHRENDKRVVFQHMVICIVKKKL